MSKTTYWCQLMCRLSSVKGCGLLITFYTRKTLNPASCEILSWAPLLPLSLPWDLLSSLVWPPGCLTNWLLNCKQRLHLPPTYWVRRWTGRGSTPSLPSSPSSRTETLGPSSWRPGDISSSTTARSVSSFLESLRICTGQKTILDFNFFFDFPLLF